MDVGSVMDMGRALAYASEGDYSDTTLLPYLNKRYHQIETAITRTVNEDYFYDIFKTDIVNGQNEYSFESSSATARGMFKILSAGVKYSSTDTYYKRVVPQSTTDFYEYIDELASTTPKLDAFCTLKNGSIFLYPSPTEDVTNGFQVEVVTTLIDLVVDGAETTIFPGNSELRGYHWILALGLAADIFAIKGMLQEKAAKEQEFENETQRMYSEIGDRFDADVTQDLPDSSEYK